MKVVLSRLPPEAFERLTTVRFDDRGRARTLGYATCTSGEINLCALPPRVSLSGVRGVKPEVFGAIRGSQWPTLAVRRFLLYSTLLHEIGHLQVIHADRRDDRRRFAEEPRADAFADTWRERLWSTPFEHPDPAHNPPSSAESATVVKGWAQAHAAYKKGLAVDGYGEDQRVAARGLYVEAVAHYPWHALALERLGCNAFTADDFAKAVELYREAIAVDRRHYNANLFLAIALGHLDRQTEARQQFDTTLRIAESRYEAHLASATYAESLGEWGVFDESERLFRNVLEKEPDSVLFLRNYASVVRERDAQEALGLFERAVLLDPEDATTRRMFGEALADCGESERAIEHLEISIRLRPSYERAATQLEEIRGGLGGGCRHSGE